MSDRQSYVEFRGAKSTYLIRELGVPKGGVSLSFNLYFSKMPSTSNKLLMQIIQLSSPQAMISITSMSLSTSTSSHYSISLRITIFFYQKHNLQQSRLLCELRNFVDENLDLLYSSKNENLHFVPRTS